MRGRRERTGAQQQTRGNEGARHGLGKMGARQEQRAPEGTGAPRNSLEDEEEDAGGEDQQQREREDAAVAGQHETAAAVEAVAAREHLPLAPWAAAAALAAAPARCGGGRRGPGARAGRRGGAGAAHPWRGGRQGSPGADLLVLAVLHAAGRGLGSASRGPAGPHRDRAEQRRWQRRRARALAGGGPAPPGAASRRSAPFAWARDGARPPRPAGSCKSLLPSCKMTGQQMPFEGAFCSFATKSVVGRPPCAGDRVKPRDSSSGLRDPFLVICNYRARLHPSLGTDWIGILGGRQGWGLGHNLL